MVNHYNNVPQGITSPLCLCLFCNVTHCFSNKELGALFTTFESGLAL